MANKFNRVFLITLLCASLTGTMLLTGCGEKDETSTQKLIVSGQLSGVSAAAAASETPKVSFSEEDTSSEYDETNATAVKLSGSTAEIVGSGASMEEKTLKITSAGTYVLSGSLSDGQILISAGKNDTVRLVLDNASVTSKDSAAIYAEKCGKTILLLKDGTKNTVSDGSGYVSDSEEDSDSPNAAIYCKDDLTILGGGSLTVTGNARNGITGKDVVRISSGTIAVNALHNGITGRDALAVEGGTISVTTTDGDGMRSTYSDTDKEDKGHITIENAEITITSGSDGIQSAKNLSVSSGKLTVTTGGGAGEAKTRQGNMGFGRGNQQQTGDSSEESLKGLKAGSSIAVTGGTVTIDAYDDAIHSNGEVYIKDGTLQIRSGDDGIHADTTLAIAGGEVIISQSYEGLEAICVDISGGLVDITATDDGINAAGGNDSSGFGNFDNNMNFGGRRFRRDSDSSQQEGQESSGSRQFGDFQPGNMPEMPSDMPGDFQPGNMPEMPSDMPGDFQPGDMPEMPNDMPGDFQPGDMPEMPGDFQPGDIPQSSGEQSGEASDSSTSGDDSSVSTELNISGGTVYISAQGDGVDSNKALNISGGLIVINGTTQGGNGVIDHDGTCTVTGGTLMGAGTSDMLEMPASTSTQKTVAILFDKTQEAGTLVYLSDSSGSILAAMTPEKSFGCVIFSSPDLKADETYTVYTGGKANGTGTHGYYSQATVSGGTEYTSFRITDTVTYVNQSGVTTYSGMGGGGRMGGMPGNRT